MASTADIQKKWQIRGEYSNGNRLAFSVMAYDYSEAKKKAEQNSAVKEGRAKISDIVLLENKRRWV